MRRHLSAAPEAGSGADNGIRNPYNKDVHWEILLLEPVNDWFLVLCKDDPATADKVEEALDELAAEERYAAYRQEAHEEEK